MHLRQRTLVFVLALWVITAYAQAPADTLYKQIRELKKRLQALEVQQQKAEQERLKQEALQVLASPDKKVSPPVFRSGQRSLQAINPEISVTGDLFFQAYFKNNGFQQNSRSGAYFRTLGFHVQSNLDPFSLTKIAFGFSPTGIALGEAYVTWTNVFPNVSLTMGKFRQEFGVINRWHKHSLDQFDFPLVIQRLFGPSGLNQTGLSAEFLLPPLWAHANTLTMQFTNGENPKLFSGALFSFPAWVGHLKNYYDLSPSTYLEVGLSALAGKNNLQGWQDGRLINQPTRWTNGAGVDLTLNWEPLQQAHYRSFTWRSEFFYIQKQTEQKATVTGQGWYSYLQFRLNERWYLGVRYDQVKDYGRSQWLKQWVAYLTWWQSHWVRFRVEYDQMENAHPWVRLQLTFAAGPHKHERY